MLQSHDRAGSIGQGARWLTDSHRLQSGRSAPGVRVEIMEKSIDAVRDRNVEITIERGMSP